MSISSFCKEQRQREQEAFKKFLTFSLAGSFVLHAVLILNGYWLFQEAVIAEDPIELIIIEETEEEVEQPKAEKLTKTPEPESNSVETLPPPQEPIETKLSKLKQPLSATLEQSSQTVMQPASVSSPTPPKTIKQSVPSPSTELPLTNRETRPEITSPSQPESVAKEATTISPLEPIAASTSAPPRPENESQALPKPTEINDNLKQNLSDLTSSEPSSDRQLQENSFSPGSVTTSTSAPPQPRQISQPLARITQEEQKLRESVSGESVSGSNPLSSAVSTTDSNSQTSPTSPGSVTANNYVPARPRGVSAPVESSSLGSQQLRESLSSGTSSSTSPDEGEEQSNPTSPGTVTIARSAPEPPKVRAGGGGLSCLRRCKPDYPSVLDGEEGRVVVRVVVDANGNVVDSTVVGGDSNSTISQEAIKAAMRMKFTKPNSGGSVEIKLGINFTVEGSEFDHRASERARQAERERQRQLEQEDLINSEMLDNK